MLEEAMLEDPMLEEAMLEELVLEGLRLEEEGLMLEEPTPDSVAVTDLDVLVAGP